MDSAKLRCCVSGRSRSIEEWEIWFANFKATSGQRRRINKSMTESKDLKTPRLRFLSEWSGLFIVAAAFIFMAAISWRKWADIVVDFGSQLYTAWQLSQGAVLYRDLIYVPGGPFAEYFNALLFKIF